MITFICFFQIIFTLSCGIWNVYAGGDMSKITASVGHRYIFIGTLNSSWQSIPLNMIVPRNPGSTAYLLGFILKVPAARRTARAGSPMGLDNSLLAWLKNDSALLSMTQHNLHQSFSLSQTGGFACFSCMEVGIKWIPGRLIHSGQLLLTGSSTVVQSPGILSRAS